MRDPDLYALCHAFLKEFFQCEEIEKKYYGNKIEFIFQLSDIQEICKKFASYIELVTYMNKNPVISKHIKNGGKDIKYFVRFDYTEQITKKHVREKLIKNGVRM